MPPSTSNYRGILRYEPAAAPFDLKRYPPAPDLALMLERYWIIRWDLRGQAPYIQETLPHPNINLAVERGRSGVFGIGTKRFTRELNGCGVVFGVKFRPGCFYPLVNYPVSRLTDSVQPLSSVLGIDDTVIEDELLSQPDDQAMIAVIEKYLRPMIIMPTITGETVNLAVKLIMHHCDITRVVQVADAVGVSQRTLQRMFRKAIGVTPKWVIMRYRLHEAVERIETTGDRDWATLAREVGYSDQAHFIRDFKKLIGVTPVEYSQGLAE